MPLATIENCPSQREDPSLFQHAFDHAAIGMALVGPDGTFLKVNGALCQITGYAEAELLARCFQDITHAEDLVLDVTNLGRMLSGETSTYEVEKRYLHKNGSVVWVLLSVALVRGAQGEACLFISQIQDITQRKQAEQRLSEAAAKIQRLQDRPIKVCAWTKRIEIDGQWISVDDFLKEHLQLQLTHGISIEGARLFKEE